MAQAGELVGSCHCGRVTIRPSRRPDQILQCNCSLCSKTGFRGVYYSSDELQIEGELDSYVRSDLKQAYLVTHRCAHCGIPTHWTPLSDPPHERMGVNARLFHAGLLDSVPVEEVDGASWDE